MTTSLWSALSEHNFAGAEVPTSLRTVRVGGAEIAENERKELIERVRAGEHVELEFEATTFIQSESPNRNFVRFRQGLLRKLAKSGTNSVFLRDHNQNNVLSRGGTITKSRAVKDDEGRDVFVQTIRLVKDWAVIGVLDGTIDRFSIGWIPTGPIVYSHNGDEVKGWPDHWPGDELEDGTVVEWVFTDAELIETSGVNVPAVVGTQIEGIREALSLALGKPPAKQPSALTGSGSLPHGETQMNGIKKILGLSDSAGEQDIAAAVGKLQTALDVETEKATSIGAELSQLKVKFEVLSAAQTEAAIDAALSDGRLKTSHDSDGKRVQSKLETILRSQAEKYGADVLSESLSALPKMFGPPSASQSLGNAPTQDPPGASTDELSDTLNSNPHLKGYMGQLGLSEEDVRKYGQN